MGLHWDSYSTAECLALALSCGRTSREQRDECIHMAEPDTPGPGRSTSEGAVNELKKEIAQRNEEAQKTARKKRAAREKEQLANRRQRDRL